MTAITDFGACLPVYSVLEPSTGKLHVASTAAQLRGYSQGALSKRALFWWCAKGGVGADPFFADMQLLPSATILQIQDGKPLPQIQYIDWGLLTQNDTHTYETAREKFVEIATSYMSAVAGPDKRVACFLSGGADSAVVAHLAKLAGLEVVGLTADYWPARYSETTRAVHAAEVLGIEHHKIKVGYAESRCAIAAMNTAVMDVPASQSVLVWLHTMGRAALALDLDCWFTGDNAGPIFLEKDAAFHGSSEAVPAAIAAAKQMSCEDYVAGLGHGGWGSG